MKTLKQYWEEIYSCMYSIAIKDFPEELKDKVDQKVGRCDECKMSMADHTTCECCQEPMCEGEDTVDMPEGWYHPDCYSDVYG